MNLGSLIQQADTHLARCANQSAIGTILPMRLGAGHARARRDNDG